MREREGESACRPGLVRAFSTSADVPGMWPDLWLRSRRFSSVLDSSQRDGPPMCPGRIVPLMNSWSTVHRGSVLLC
jgi:hypothetical protein